MLSGSRDESLSQLPLHVPVRVTSNAKQNAKTNFTTYTVFIGIISAAKNHPRRGCAALPGNNCFTEMCGGGVPTKLTAICDNAVPGCRTEESLAHT